MAASTISLCQSSIHNFLNNIPNQASELAVNVVNNFIEDQVADPKKFEQNISRVKSVFSRRCLGYSEADVNGRDYGGGDGPNADTKTLLTIPRKARQIIWQHLDDNSVKTLRSVCRQLKHEMDYDVGLSITLSTAAFHDIWIKSISIRSCTIRQLDTLLQLNQLAKPEKLEKIYFDPDLDIDADMIELVIRKFRNLRQLTVFTEDVVEMKTCEEDAVSKGTSSKLITRLEDQFQLTSIDIKLDTIKWKLKWNIKLIPQIFDKYWEIKEVVGHFGLTGITRIPCSRDLSKKSLKIVTLSIPFVQDRDRHIWLRVLQTQNVLSSLTCDLNATHWKEYEKIIITNKKTLRKLFLLNITCTPNTRWKTELPFDWKMFENCVVLEEITLIADTFLRSAAILSSERTRRYMECTNISFLQTCPLLRAVWMENYKLIQEDMAFLQHSDCRADESTEDARFELCTLKNCLVNSEEVLELQVGRKRGRNRSLECLCFGTTSYDDDDLENFDKYTTDSAGQLYATRSDTNMLTTDWDMIECFHNKSVKFERDDNERTGKVCDSINLIAGIALTAWLYWC